MKLKNLDKKDRIIIIITMHLITLLIFLSRQNNDKFVLTMMAPNSGFNIAWLLMEMDNLFKHRVLGLPLMGKRIFIIKLGIVSGSD